MKRYSSFQIEAAFEEIWNLWPNKDNQHAALKSFNVAIAQGADLKLLVLACKIYAIENAGQEFTHKLRNFILNDDWRDTVEGFKDVESYAENLELRRKEAIEVINTWNQRCKSHWCPSLDIEARIPIAIKALKDNFFKDNWKKGLDKISEIFRLRPRENDRFRHLTISLPWFCDVRPDKHTVLKVLEGQYGEPVSDIEKRYPKRIVVSDEEAKKIAEENKKLFKDVFGTTNSSSSTDLDEEEDVGIY